MPKTIHDKPVDEEKWAKAKTQAAKAGHGENYSYIMGIYKQMVGMKSSPEQIDLVKSHTIQKVESKNEAVDSDTGSSHNNDRGRHRLVMRKPAFQEIRCECGALLFREVRKSDSTDRVIEIKCRKCGAVRVS